MFLASIMYVLFELTGLLVTTCSDKHTGVCNKYLIYTVVITGSLVCGFAASFIWVNMMFIIGSSRSLCKLANHLKFKK